MNTIEGLLQLLEMYGGKIISSNELQPEWIEQARASNRMYVDEYSLGYVWEPPITRIPETEEELYFFEKWFPLPVKLPEDINTLEKLLKRKRDDKK